MEKRYISIEEASEYTGYPINTLYSLVHQRRIPHSKRVRRLRFDRQALDEWMQEGERPVTGLEDNNDGP